MKKININKQDLEVCFEKLDNGLEIYVIKKESLKTIYTTFSTKYGSNINEFVPLDGKKMTKFPDGIAHFLEHKMFEQEDGTDPFSFFNERGCDANANTSNYKTTYLFSGTNFFCENLNFLLDYVQKPYFTDENVEKEKGIIKQEIKMYLDDPYTRLYEKSIYNSFIKLPIKVPIIGNIKSINSITKDDLYACYNTFYHPSNMFIVVVGNVDPDKVINLIKENQSKKEFAKPFEIKTKKYNEPDAVDKKTDHIKMDVNIPKVSVNYKIRVNKYDDISERIVKLYLSIYFDILYGNTSELSEKLKLDGIIDENIIVNYIDTDTHVLFLLMADTKKTKEFIKAIKGSKKDLDNLEDELERKKKVLISSLVFASDNVFSINHRIMNQVVKYGKILDNEYEDIKALNIDDFKRVIGDINFDNDTTVIITGNNKADV